MNPLCVNPLCVNPLCVNPLCVNPLCRGLWVTDGSVRSLDVE